MSKSANDDLKEVWNYADRASAEVGKYRLAEKGIEAEVFGDKVDTMYMTAIGGISLLVKRNELAAAKEILTAVEDVPEDVVAPGEEIGEGRVFCSSCHSLRVMSRKIRYTKGGSWLRNAVKGWMGYREAFHCRDCKKGWAR